MKQLGNIIDVKECYSIEHKLWMYIGKKCSDDVKWEIYHRIQKSINNISNTNETIINVLWETLRNETN